MTLGQSYYGTTITRAKGLEIQKIAPDGSKKSRMVLNSDTLPSTTTPGERPCILTPPPGPTSLRAR